MNLSSEAIAAVAENEGGKGRDPYASINRNTDGQGLSFGLFQWTQRSGSLQRLLGAMYGYAPVDFRRTFGKEWPTLLQDTKKLRLWESPWIERFETAARNPALREAQAAFARVGSHAKTATELTQEAGFRPSSVVGAVLLDVSVNQGESAARALVRRRLPTDFSTLSPLSAAKVVAVEAPQRYRWVGMDLPSTVDLNAAGKAGSGTWIEVAPQDWHKFTRNERVDIFAMSRGRLENVIKAVSGSA